MARAATQLQRRSEPDTGPTSARNELVSRSEDIMTTLRNFKLATACAALAAAAAAQQPGSIAGVVTDQNGDPVVGATVLLSGVGALWLTARGTLGPVGPSA